MLTADVQGRAATALAVLTKSEACMRAALAERVKTHAALVSQRQRLRAAGF